MKRPLFTIGLCWLCASGVLVLVGSAALLWLPALAVCLLAAALWLSHKIKATLIAAALSVLAACGVFWLHTATFITPLQRLAGQRVEFQGTVIAMREAGGATAYDLYGRFVGDGLPTRTLTLPVLALGDEQELAIGDRLGGSFLLELPKDATQLAFGRPLQAIQGEVAPINQPLPTGPVIWGALLRSEMLAAIERSIPGREGALVAGVLLSEQADIDPDTAADLRRSGVAHILSVSGYHLSVAVGLMGLLAAKLGWGKRLTGLIGAVCCLVIMAIAGFTPSVMRSGIMTLLWLLGQQLGRRSDSLTSLSFAAIVMLAANPYMLLSKGFILSFTSVLSIILFATPLQSFLTRKLADKRAEPGWAGRLVLSAFSVTAGASVLSYPVQAALFGVLPTYGLIGNLMLTPLVPVVMAAGAVAAALGMAGLWSAAGVAGWVAAQATGLLARVAGNIALLPGSWLPITEGYLLLWLFGAAAVLIGLAVLRPHYRVVLFTITGLVLPLLVGSFSWTLLSRDSIRLVSFDTNGCLAILRGDAAAVVGVSAQKGEMGARQLVASLEELGANDIHLMMDDSITAPMARAAAQIQQLRPLVAVLPARQWGAADYLPAKTALWPREVIRITTLGGVQITPSDSGMTLIEIGQIRVLKLSHGYDILGKTGWLSNLDVIVSPKGDFEVLNPNIRVWHDLAGRKTIRLRHTDEE